MRKRNLGYLYTLNKDGELIPPKNLEGRSPTHQTFEISLLIRIPLVFLALGGILFLKHMTGFFFDICYCLLATYFLIESAQIIGTLTPFKKE